MFYDIETLEMRNGWLYIRCITANWSEPERYHIYWPLKVRFMDWAHRFRSTEEAQQAIGYKMRHLGNGSYEGPLGLVYRLPDGGSTKPEFTETERVPEPVQRGRKLEIRWHEGEWQKYTQSKGWVRA